MKRKIKNACIIIGLGGVLILIGVMMGGGIKKTFYRTLNNAFYGYTNEHFYGYADEGASMDDDYRDSTLLTDIPDTELISDASGIKQLKVDISYAELRIEPHDKQSIIYSITRDTNKIGTSVTVQGNSLNITTNRIHGKRKWSWFFGWYRDRYENFDTIITVKIPRNALFEHADIRVGAAPLFLDGFTAQKSFILNTGVGEVTVTNITASHVEITTGVGETVFKNCNFTDTAMKTGVGETSFDGTLLKSVNILTGIGETTLRINGKKSDYAIDVISGIGSVFVDGANSSSFVRTSIKNAKQDAVHTIRVHAGIGAVNIDFTE